MLPDSLLDPPSKSLFYLADLSGPLSTCFLIDPGAASAPCHLNSAVFDCTLWRLRAWEGNHITLLIICNHNVRSQLHNAQSRMRSLLCPQVVGCPACSHVHVKMATIDVLEPCTMGSHANQLVSTARELEHMSLTSRTHEGKLLSGKYLWLSSSALHVVQHEADKRRP